MNSSPLRLLSRLRWITIVLALVLVRIPTPAAEAPRKNIIFILTDDQAHWSLGAYGNREARTPNMDRLAREGARFLNAFTCTPVCSPSRAAMLTGRYGTQVGITDYIDPKEAKAGVGLPPGTMTWPKVLQQRGYQTGLIGKWHLGEKPEMHPTKMGFDYFYGALGGAFKPKDPELEVDGQPTKLAGFGADLITDAALGFIETHRAHPFALLIHYREPHLPYDPVPEQDSAPFKDLDPTIPAFANLRTNQVKYWTRLYYAAIHSVDRNLGRLLARLEEWKLAENTIIVFTSDHGYMIGQHGLHTKGNAHWVVGGATGPKRPNMFEESLRVPLLIRWPGVIAPGVEVTETVSNIDTYATVLGMLGIKPPRKWKQQGVDFSPLLRGERFTPHAAIFGQYDLHNGGLAYLRMVRTSEWKLVRHHFSHSLDELYDLKADPGELKNRFDDHACESIRAELQQQLTAWQRRIKDPILQRLETEK